MRKRVVITGLGCVSPVGNDVQTTWVNVLAGKSGVGPITHFDSQEYKTKIAAELKDFNIKAIISHREARRMDLVSQYALVAAMQAVEHADLAINDENRDRIGSIIGTGIGGIGTLFDNMKILLEKGPLRVSPFLIPKMLPDTPVA